MPQMAPLFWLLLLSFFIIVLLLFLIMNYFITPLNTLIFPNSKSLSLQKPWKL